MFENSELLSTELQEISHTSAFTPVKFFEEYVEVAKKNSNSNVVTWKKINFSDMDKIIKELKQKITTATNKYLFYYAYNKVLCNISKYEYFNDEVLLDFGNSHLFGIVDSKQLVSKLDDELLSKAYYDFFCAPLLNENAVYNIDLLSSSSKKNFQLDVNVHVINNEISVSKLEESKRSIEEKIKHMLSNIELMKKKIDDSKKEELKQIKNEIGRLTKKLKIYDDYIGSIKKLNLGEKVIFSDLNSENKRKVLEIFRHNSSILYNDLFAHNKKISDLNFEELESSIFLNLYSKNYPDISTLIKLFHKYIVSCNRESKIINVELINDLCSFVYQRANSELEYIKVGLNDEYEVLACYLLSQLDFENIFSINDDELEEMSEKLLNHASKITNKELKEINDICLTNIPFNREEIVLNVQKFISNNHYRKGIIEKNINIMRNLTLLKIFKHDVIQYYINSINGRDKKECLIELSKFNLPIIYEYIITNFDFKFIDGNLCIIDKDKNAYPVSINILKSDDKVTNFSALLNPKFCLEIGSLYGLNYAQMLKKEYNDSECNFFWDVLSKAENDGIKIKYSLMYDNDGKKSIFFFSKDGDIEENYRAFSMLYPYEYEKGKDGLYYSGHNNAFIYFRKRDDKQNLWDWMVTDRKKYTNDIENFVELLESDELAIDFMFLEELKLEFTKDDLTVFDSLLARIKGEKVSYKTKNLLLDLIKSKKQEKLRKYGQNLEKLIESVEQELWTISNPQENKNENKFENEFFDISKILDVKLSEIEKKKILTKIFEQLCSYKLHNDFLIKSINIQLRKVSEDNVDEAFISNLLMLKGVLDYSYIDKNLVHGYYDSDYAASKVDDYDGYYNIFMETIQKIVYLYDERMNYSEKGLKNIVPDYVYYSISDKIIKTFKLREAIEPVSNITEFVDFLKLMIKEYSVSLIETDKTK